MRHLKPVKDSHFWLFSSQSFVRRWNSNNICYLCFPPKVLFRNGTYLKWYCDKSIHFLFSSDVKSMFVWRLVGKILSFELYPKAILFECKFRISRPAFIHVQDWLIGPQRFGLRIRWCQRLDSLKLQIIVHATHKFKSLKVWNSCAAYY